MQALAQQAIKSAPEIVRWFGQIALVRSSQCSPPPACPKSPECPKLPDWPTTLCDVRCAACPPCAGTASPAQEDGLQLVFIALVFALGVIFGLLAVSRTSGRHAARGGDGSGSASSPGATAGVGVRPVRSSRPAALASAAAAGDGAGVIGE